MSAAEKLDKSLHILQHALGLDQYGRGTFYRNHFVTGEGGTDHPHCMALVAAGFMNRHVASEISGGMDGFTVTAAGRAYVVEASPKPPKQTRGQKRYAAYLRADCSMTFGQWLRAGR